MPKARAAALRALELDDRLPEAQISALGMLGHRLASRTRAPQRTGRVDAGEDKLLGCTLGVRHEVKGVVPFAEKSLYGTVGC